MSEHGYWDAPLEVEARAQEVLDWPEIAVSDKEQELRDLEVLRDEDIDVSDIPLQKLRPRAERISFAQFLATKTARNNALDLRDSVPKVDETD
ncbi:hypothetical protein [Terriglobus sp.]|uniref:hypothetical protein n=1 Tax=Terriglobus sp. TaxID=1889013 RepID=UPI003B008975